MHKKNIKAKQKKGKQSKVATKKTSGQDEKKEEQIIQPMVVKTDEKTAKKLKKYIEKTAKKKKKKVMMIAETKLGVTMVLSKDDCKKLGYDPKYMTTKEAIQNVRRKLGLGV